MRAVRHQVAAGEEELLLVGLQGRSRSFEELPPLNLAFVIDKSGSIATVLVPSTEIQDDEARARLERLVASIQPGYGTNLVAGMELGYREVLSNHRAECVNRALFLTDGVGESTGLLDMARSFAARGINVSAFGPGTSFDAPLMRTSLPQAAGSPGSYPTTT